MHFDDLMRFIEHDMRMSHLHEPVMPREVEIDRLVRDAGHSSRTGR
jgi:hypothetical protein